MRFISGAKSAYGVRSAHAKLAIAATLASTCSLAQATQANDCGQYAADAVAQSQEYQNLGCSGGSPDWWRVDLAYHRNWCVSLPAGSTEPARGTASREAVLKQCRQARQSQPPAVVSPPQVQRPPQGSSQQGQRPPVFQGTVCNRWDVWLHQGGTGYFRGLWERGQGFFYRATWGGQGGTIERYVYPLNAKLSFWSEDTASNVFFFYYNDKGWNLRTGQIGGPWEAEAANGELRDRGTWGARCLDR